MLLLLLMFVGLAHRRGHFLIDALDERLGLLEG